MAGEKKLLSELRYNVMSKDWVVIATGRAKRPEMFRQNRRKEKEVLKSPCPFCKLGSENEATLIISSGEKISIKEKGRFPENWTTLAIKNKYPAFAPISNPRTRSEGEFYKSMDAAGYHEVVVTRDHDRSLALLSIERIKEVIDVYQQRYLELMEKPSVRYISIFHNHGKEAGASISHPHSQIITTPLIDTDLEKAISNAKAYYRKHKKNIYFLMDEWERKSKKRIVFENKDFLVLCPFASKSAFEIIISPKKPSPYFERISEKEKESLAEAFKKALYSLYKGLGDPAYNFYLHSAPCDNKEYGYYHWHWTILPKTSIWAGFELGAGMEISTIEPEKAAAYLRKQIS